MRRLVPRLHRTQLCCTRYEDVQRKPSPRWGLMRLNVEHCIGRPTATKLPVRYRFRARTLEFFPELGVPYPKGPTVRSAWSVELLLWDIVFFQWRTVFFSNAFFCRFFSRSNAVSVVKWPENVTYHLSTTDTPLKRWRWCQYNAIRLLKTKKNRGKLLGSKVCIVPKNRVRHGKPAPHLLKTAAMVRPTQAYCSRCKRMWSR